MRNGVNQGHHPLQEDGWVNLWRGKKVMSWWLIWKKERNMDVCSLDDFLLAIRRALRRTAVPLVLRVFPRYEGRAAGWGLCQQTYSNHLECVFLIKSKLNFHLIQFEIAAFCHKTSCHNKIHILNFYSNELQNIWHHGFGQQRSVMIELTNIYSIQQYSLQYYTL